MFQPRPLNPHSPEWDPRLDILPAARKQLRVLGQLPEGPRAAIVGTRRSDPEADAFTRELAHVLARRGVCIVSGGARGIDASAHEGALAAEAGRTVVVLGSGLHRPYPAEHAPLFARAATKGALLSLQGDEAPPRRGTFLARNTVIAALADVTVVVQAPQRSGACSTARAAQRFGRPLLVVPASPWDLRGGGNIALLASGARCAPDARSVLRALGLEDRADRGDKTSLSQRAGAEVEARDGAQKAGDPLLSLLGSRPRHVDELAAASSLDAASLQRRLMRLILDGTVEARPGGRYVRRP